MFGVETIVPIGLFITVTILVLGTARVISEGRTRRRLIEAGMTSEVARSLGGGIRDDIGTYSALKWGIVAVSAGLALVVIQFLPYSNESPIVPGIILLFVGVGLLAYWTVTRKVAARLE